jgi:hypothetical protein
MTAFHTNGVFEIEQLLAVLTPEEFHRDPCPLYNPLGGNLAAQKRRRSAPIVPPHREDKVFQKNPPAAPGDSIIRLDRRLADFDLVAAAPPASGRRPILARRRHFAVSAFRRD